MQYSSSTAEHICAMWQPYLFVVYVKYVYSAHVQMFDYSDFIFGDIYVYASSIQVYQIYI